MRFSAIVVAAGTGSRAGSGVAKQWRLLAGRPVARWSVEAMLAAGADPVIVVAPVDGHADAQRAMAGLPVTIISGGQTRAQSVRAGLEALGEDDPDIVLIHDAARPLLARAPIERLLEAAARTGAAILALPLADTLKREGTTTVDRAGLWRAQTPQGFDRRMLMAAHASWTGPGEATDDAQVVERAGGRVELVPGDPRLMKLTYPEDFTMAEALAGAARVTRVGQGFDAHRFGEGDRVWLCGVDIAHDQTLAGHSDADVGIHALVDAILGAIGQGDIGDHFPPSDPQWKGAPSHLFLRRALELTREVGGRLINVDVTLICEAPRIKPHRQAMRARLADLLDLPVDRVSVKATTTEGMGFTGRREGIAAQAIAAVEMPL